jgi:NAD(P)-dependent dehydrogenase (short-subunit alcohol dehydrogenase family)
MSDKLARPLEGARVLVFGSGPMGVATARLAAQAGADVTLSGRSQERLAAAGVPAGVPTLVGNPETPEGAQALLHEAGPVDHLAVIAGAARGTASSIPDTPSPAAQSAFIRFWLSYNLLWASPGQVRQSITLLSGASSRKPAAGRGVWGTLHAAIEALGRNAALELAPLRVNTLSPGGIGISEPDRQLLEHLGRPDDVGAMAVALMANPAVTASIYDVDGGEGLAVPS